MRIDIYTKSILTMIAVLLFWICLQNHISPQIVSAQSSQRVVIVGDNGVPLAVQSIGSGAPLPQTALPVSIVQSIVPMNIGNVVRVQTLVPAAWEYRVAASCSQVAMNDLGAQGWKHVATVTEGVFDIAFRQDRGSWQGLMQPSKTLAQDGKDVCLHIMERPTRWEYR